MSALRFDQALLPTGWARDVRVEVGDDGRITSVRAAAPAERGDSRHAVGVPGVANCHSHAFQRAMAGLTERRGRGDDSFWTWREAMYGFLARLGPDQVRAIAALAYVEMLERGFTRVAEFHYLHHDVDGRPYADRATMSTALLEAASQAGIGITLLPVLYQNGGFGGAPAGPAQRRFVNDCDGFAELFERACAQCSRAPHASCGLALHSLRAVTPQSLHAALALAGERPVHIHVAEQLQEVDACLAWSGLRPVEWLLANAPVDGRWCLVHATHLSAAERDALAASGAVAGLCPITEANLGDGVFDAVRYLAAGGRIAIGSDSNVRVSLAGELEMLEYSQRLRDRARARLAPPGGSVARYLLEHASRGGAVACAADTGLIAPGAQADLVALDPEHPSLAGCNDDRWLDAWIFSAGDAAVRDVWRGGQHLVRDGRHVAREGVVASYRHELAALTA